MGVEDSHLVELFKGNTFKMFTTVLKRFAGYSFDVRHRYLGIMVAHDNKPYKEVDRNTELEGKATFYIDCREMI